MAKKLWKSRITLEIVAVGDTALDVQLRCPEFFAKEVAALAACKPRVFTVHSVSTEDDLPPRFSWPLSAVPYGQDGMDHQATLGEIMDDILEEEKE